MKRDNQPTLPSSWIEELPAAPAKLPTGYNQRRGTEPLPTNAERDGPWGGETQSGHRLLSTKARAAIAGGLVQGIFVLAGLAISAWIASTTLTRELRVAQTASAVTMFMDGMAEERLNPQTGSSKIAAGRARLASYGDQELVEAMAELRRCVTERTVMHLFRVLRTQADAGEANTRDLIAMYDVASDGNC